MSTVMTNAVGTAVAASIVIAMAATGGASARAAMHARPHIYFYRGFAGRDLPASRGDSGRVFAGHNLGGRAFYGSHFGYGFGNPGPGWGLRGPD